MNKVFIGEIVIETEGLAWCSELSLDDLKKAFNKGDLLNGWHVSRDDDYDYYIGFAGEFQFASLRKVEEMFIAAKAKFFNMEEICKIAKVSYKDYREWYDGDNERLSDDEIEYITTAILTVAREYIA